MKVAGYNGLGKIMIFAGLLLVVLGALLSFFGGNLGWLFHLPGDIRIERENFKFYFPITTMILITVVLNLLIRLLRFFLN